MSVISPQLVPVYDTLTTEFEEGRDYLDLGLQVLWVPDGRGGVKRRYIGMTSRLSQHVGGNAWDVAPFSQSLEHIGVIDRMARRARDLGARVLWRDVINHFPHHAHIEGMPAYSQPELEAFYDNEEDDVTTDELVGEIQAALINAGYSVGPSGADKIWGRNTRAAFNQMCVDAKASVSIDADHRHQIPTTTVTGTVTGVPI